MAAIRMNYDDLRQPVQYLIDLLGRQILVIVEVDLKHRRGTARAETLNLGQRKTPVSGRFTDLDAEFLRTVFGDLSGAANLARECSADLYVILADGLGMNHRVEGGDFPDVCDAQLQPIGKV